MTKKFDFDQALEKLQSGKGLLGEDGVLIPIIKQLTEAKLQSEMEQHLSKKQLQIVEMAMEIKQLNRWLDLLN